MICQLSIVSIFNNFHYINASALVILVEITFFFKDFWNLYGDLKDILSKLAFSFKDKILHSVLINWTILGVNALT